MAAPGQLVRDCPARPEISSGTTASCVTPDGHRSTEFNGELWAQPDVCDNGSGRA